MQQNLIRSKYIQLETFILYKHWQYVFFIDKTQFMIPDKPLIRLSSIKYKLQDNWNVNNQRKYGWKSANRQNYVW